MTRTRRMPPLTGELARQESYYRLTWLSDGYPGRREEARVWAHPLYGAYALLDYLDQMERRPSAELRGALSRVAGAAVARMRPHEDALVFWYEQDDDNSRAAQPYYSGLTQSHYAAHLARAGVVLGDPSLMQAAHSAFASLTIPVEKAGVYSAGLSGPHIAELSQQPRNYILNGWQSALAAIVQYANLTSRADARQLARDSAQEMARLLPLYDAPALRNSRYSLSGFVYARLIFRGADRSGVTLGRVRLAIPGEGVLPVDRVGGSRWDNHVLPQDVEAVDGALRPAGNLVRLNLVLSRISYPQPNRLLGEVTGPGGVVEVQVQRGRYDPRSSSQTDRAWATVARVERPSGTSTIDVPLPWDLADLVAYPPTSPNASMVSRPTSTTRFTSTGCVSSRRRRGFAILPSGPTPGFAISASGRRCRSTTDCTSGGDAESLR